MERKIDIQFDLNSENAVFFLKGKILTPDCAQYCEEIVLENVDDQIEICMDLTGLEYLNSLGIGVFIKLFTKFRNNGKKIFFKGVNDKIANIFAVSKMNTILDIR